MQLLCIGDVALASDCKSQLVWMPLGGEIPGKGARIMFNWELPIGDTLNPVPRSSGPRLLAHPDSLRIIQMWSPGFATLANNHVMDAGEEGLISTISSLRHMGFTTVGAGRNQEEITRSLFWETKEGRLAVVNWVFPETHPDWMSVPGPNCWPGPEEANRIIQELKRNADWVLIVVHWSDEHFPYPRPEDRAVAYHIAQMGADMIIGHHPHVVRSMEVLASCPVFYSIGNFYFSDVLDSSRGRIVQPAPRNREGLGVQVSFRRGRRLEYEVLSFWQAKGLVISDSTHRAVKRMKRVSLPLIRFQNSEYSEWYRLKRVRFDRWGSRWHFGFRRLGISGTILYLLRWFNSKLSEGL